MRLDDSARALAVVVLVTTSAIAQVQTLTQSVNNTLVSNGNSAACTPTGSTITLDNGYFRTYSLAALPGSIEIVSITFGVQNVVTSLPGGFPVVIRLFNDPTPAAIAPYAGLVLRHTENVTQPPTATPTLVTRAMTGPPVTFSTSDQLVVEIFSPDAVYIVSRFVIGSNNFGQSAPGYLRAPLCGLLEPTDTTALPGTAIPMHMIIDVNYVVSVPPAFPGTGEDLHLLTAVNANPLTSGIANQIKTVTAGDTLTVEVLSPGGTFNYRELVLAAQPFITGLPPFPPLAPGIPFSFPGIVLLIGGTSGPFGPTLLSPAGTAISLAVPPGLAGASVIFQGIVITWFPPLAANGIYASTDAHEIQVT